METLDRCFICRGRHQNLYGYFVTGAAEACGDGIVRGGTNGGIILAGDAWHLSQLPDA